MTPPVTTTHPTQHHNNRFRVIFSITWDVWEESGECWGDTEREALDWVGRVVSCGAIMGIYNDLKLKDGSEQNI